jgi:nucleoside-triphosphatase
MSEPSLKNVLLTGSPECGKMTVIRRLIERLGGLRLSGFYTQEIRERRQRLGFLAIGLHGEEALLAHVQSRSKLPVGRHGVESGCLQPLVQAELAKPAGEVDVFLIDEIGKMELNGPAFVERLPLRLSGPIPVVATVALKGSGLSAQVKDWEDVRLVQVRNANRDDLPEELEAWLRGHLQPGEETRSTGSLS